MPDEHSRQKLMEHDTEYDLRAVNAAAPKARYRWMLLLALVIAFILLGLLYRELSKEQFRLSREMAEMKESIRRLSTELAAQQQTASKKAEFRARWEKGRFFSRAIRLPHSGAEARSVSWADYDGDGDLDALVCSRTNHLYRNNNGTFADVTSAAGLTGGSRCAFWADYDNDGDLDVFYSSARLWTNDGGRFTDDSSLLPRYPFSNTEGGGWLDANRDGLPDILISDGGSGIHLILNQKEGEPRFLNADAEWGLGPQGIGVGNGDFLSIADYDGNGFPDFLHNLRGAVLGRNMDGQRFELAQNAGVVYVSESPWKFGTAFGDFDNDGDLDLFVPQRGQPFLYLNRGDGTFANVITDTGDLAVTGVDAWSAVWGDVNTDGLLDLIVGYPSGPMRLFLNRGNGEMDDETFVSGLPYYRCSTSSTGMVLADYDNDGDLDLLVTGERTESAILVNDWPREDGHLSLRARLPAVETPGASVRLYDHEQKLLGTRQLGLVQTFSSQGPPEALFGVRAGKYRVVVRRTNGEVLTHEVEIAEEDAVLDVEPAEEEEAVEEEVEEEGEEEEPGQD